MKKIREKTGASHEIVLLCLAIFFADASHSTIIPIFPAFAKNRCKPRFSFYHINVMSYLIVMSGVEKVTEDLYMVKHEMRPGWFCSVLVFFGEKQIGIVDSGFMETARDMILPLIKEHDRRLDEVNILVNTHRDGDHIKGNKVLKEQTGTIIAAHRLEAEAIPDVDRLLEDGEIVVLGDRSFKVIHTPGHRPGAICLYEQNTGLLVTDDVVCGTREDLIRMDKEIYIKSLKKLQTLEAETMIMSHPFEPAGKNVLIGKEIEDMIKASIKIAEKL